jgi:hypothetical protein
LLESVANKARPSGIARTLDHVLKSLLIELERAERRS